MCRKNVSDNEASKYLIFYEQKKRIEYRKLVNKMFYEEDLSHKAIVKRTGMSRRFVRTWTSSLDMNFEEDRRGWPKGKRRKWSPQTEERILLLHKSLEEDPKEFYLGATAVEHAWRLRYKRIAPPPLRTIGQMMSDLGLSRPLKRDRKKGAARYLCYPEHTIYETLASRLMEADFIGEKYLAGESNPLHFIGFSFKKAPKLRHYQRVKAETAHCFMEACQLFFDEFETPDAVKVDNCLATIGSASGRRNISKSMQFLLKRNVTPIFAVPRKPFSQASIEGNNSVFAKRFWTKRTFRSVSEVDKQLAWFNSSSQAYTDYHRPGPNKSKESPFKPRIYFIRQVCDHNEKGRFGCINVLNEIIKLPKEYIKYFVLARWDLNSESLSVMFEKKNRAHIIERVPFKINTMNLDI